MAPITPTFEHWRRTASTYRHRGHAIAYRVEGDGPVLVAIHGFPSASWDWAPIWAQLTSRFRVVAADMIGFGDSPAPSELIFYIHDRNVRGNIEQPHSGHYCDPAILHVGTDNEMFLGLNWAS